MAFSRGGDTGVSGTDAVEVAGGGVDCIRFFFFQAEDGIRDRFT